MSIGNCAENTARANILVLLLDASCDYCEIELGVALCYSFTWRNESMEEKEIREILFKVNAEFREAFDRHQKLDKQLVQFQSRSYMTEEDERKEKEIKKTSFN